MVEDVRVSLSNALGHGCLFQMHWVMRQWVVEDVRVSLSNALGHEAMGGRGCQGVSFKCTGS